MVHVLVRLYPNGPNYHYTGPIVGPDHSPSFMCSCASTNGCTTWVTSSFARRIERADGSGRVRLYCWVALSHTRTMFCSSSDRPMMARTDSWWSVRPGVGVRRRGGEAVRRW